MNAVRVGNTLEYAVGSQTPSLMREVHGPGSRWPRIA